MSQYIHRLCGHGKKYQDIRVSGGIWMERFGYVGALYTLINKDINSNAIIGDGVKMIDCKNCIVRVPDERKVILQGLDGYIVVESGGRLLVCRKYDEQKISEWNK